MTNGRLKAQILAALNEYQEPFYALDRGDLCDLTGVADREVRAAVAELRYDGHLIVIAEDGGYRIAQSMDEAHAFVETLTRRLVALAATIAAMETAASAQFGGDDGGI